MTARPGSAILLAAALLVGATVFIAPMAAFATPVTAPASTPASTPTATPSTAPNAETTEQPASAQPVAPQTNSSAVNAATNAATTNPVTSSISAKPVATTPVVGSNPVSLASGLIFLLALVVIAAWLVKRSGAMPAWRSGSSMKVVAALSVGPRERVLLIEMAGQQWLLGVTPTAINNLHHFAQPIVTAGSADEFSSKLRQLLPQGFGK